jgi:dolichol-phosphate mannosyltransferase
MNQGIKHEGKTDITHKNDVLIDSYPSGFNPRFAILMPVHNEEGSIYSVVTAVRDKLCMNDNYPIEIILAEDGSKDTTKEVIIDLSKKIPLKAILSYDRKGYAGGIKNGLKLVSAPYVIISDSDGQHRPEDFWRLKDMLAEFGFRKDVIVSGCRTSRSDALHRRIISKTFQKLNSIVFDLAPLKDITSPFKLMSTELAGDISSKCKYMNESFWTEFVVRASYSGNITTVEIPVRHASRLEGETVVYKKSKIPRIVIDQLIALINLKKDLTGKGIVRSLLQTKSIRRLISFALVGASGAGIILLLTWIGTELFRLHYILSAATGIEVSIVWAFLLNDKFTFRDKIQSPKTSYKFIRMLKYHVSALSGEAINLSMLYLLTTIGLFYLSSEAIAILVAFGYNFTISSKWVWRRPH